MFKAYIDTVVIAGKTIKYTTEGPVGLLQSKKGIHIHARGGVYSGDNSIYDFGDKYLKTIMGMIGIQMMDSVIAEGMSYAPDKAEEIKQAAIQQCKNAAKAFAYD